jgi:dTDP-4-amino-4,6-dideoxy-D-galactose acyltransferase
MSKAAAADLVACSDSENIKCLYFLCECDDANTLSVAEDVGFRVVDVRMILDATVPDDSRIVYSDVRPSKPEDLPALRRIAGISHQTSRFYFDEQFPKGACDLLYETWIEKSCQGWADIVLVAAKQKGACGYITCHLENGTGRIGLFAVAPEVQNQGLGRLLLHASLCWFKERGCRTVQVTTQGRNVLAQRVYQAAGFRTAAVHLWLHRWAKGARAGAQ